MRINKYAIYEVILFHIYVLVYAITFPEKDSWSITLILLAFVAALLICEYFRTKLFASPLFFWYAFWLGAITIGRMNLGIGVYPLYQVWSERLRNIVLVNTEAFFWFYYLGEYRKGQNCGVCRQAEKPLCSSIKGDLFADLVIGLLLVASLAYAVNVVYTGNIPQLTGDANSYRETFVATRYYQIVGLLRFTVACVPPAVAAAKSRVKKDTLIFLTVLFFLEEMLSGWRGYTLQALILLVSSALLISDTENAKSRERNLILVAGSAVLAAAFIIYITVTRDGSFEAFEVRVKYAIDNFYLYIAPNFLNFQTAVEKVVPKGYLMYSVEAFWGLLFPAWENPQYIWLDMEYEIGAYNVCTYLLEPYCDLGVPGTVLWTSAIAFFSGKTFNLARTRNNIFSIVAVGTFNIIIFFMHNNFFLRSSSVLIWLTMGAILSWFVMRRDSKQNGRKVI